MLRKLMKHEFRATGRIMLPLYLVLLATAFGANLSARGLLNTRYRILDMLGVLLVMAFGIAIFAVCIMSVVVMVQRFYKNLLQDEGYVMLTLPVSVHQQVWSKLIVSAVWFAATVAMVIAAACIVAFDIDFIKYFFQGVGELFGELRKLEAYYAVNGTAIALEVVALCFLGCCAMCLQFYAALAVGHSFASHKMAWSVAFFFIFQFAVQMVTSMIVIFADATGLDYFLANYVHLSYMASIHALMIFLIACVVVYGAIFYVVTTYFLKKRLNLE
ncbi:MAG: hypothetical protein Q4C45_06190 [Oscillospiraceae bacterium]|nr:hypothetical protein [Oscillospiraceae bacterium]